MYQDRVHHNNALGLGIAQYVSNLWIAQKCFNIDYILMMC